MRKISTFLLGLTPAVLLSACVTTGSSAPHAGGDAAQLAGRCFTLADTDLDAATTPRLEFSRQADGSLAMHGKFCNDFRGPATLLPGQRLESQGLVFTRKFCLAEPLNSLEATFQQTLRNGANWRFDGQTLVLTGEGQPLRFSPCAA
ncbi:MAG: META domain-containing protein [Zoogloeaceae bacterium]|jgi:heat shock protein HslJ|nr:META domain-containing protein [Zoogloeaceae bacterium]